jgi:CheY-like chemotaxis protein
MSKTFTQEPDPAKVRREFSCPVKTLVIDDDEGTRLVLRTLLEAQGYEVIECANAEEAAAEYSRQLSPLIFLDLFLPGMSGFEFCRWLQAATGGRPDVRARGHLE